MMTMKPSVVILPLGLLLVLVMIGCSSNSALFGSRNGPDRTGGISLSMLVTDEKAKIVDLSVNPAGQLQLVGGRDRLLHNEGTVTDLTDDEVETLTDLISQAGWLTPGYAPPADLIDPNENEPISEYHVKIRFFGGKNSFTTRASGGPVLEIYTLLIRAATRAESEKVLEHLQTSTDDDNAQSHP